MRTMMNVSVLYRCLAITEHEEHAPLLKIMVLSTIQSQLSRARGQQENWKLQSLKQDMLIKILIIKHQQKKTNVFRIFH